MPECEHSFISVGFDHDVCEECGADREWDAPYYPDGDENCIPSKNSDKPIDNRWS